MDQNSFLQVWKFEIATLVVTSAWLSLDSVDITRECESKQLIISTTFLTSAREQWRTKSSYYLIYVFRKACNRAIIQHKNAIVDSDIKILFIHTNLLSLVTSYNLSVLCWYAYEVINLAWALINMHIFKCAECFLRTV